MLCRDGETALVQRVESSLADSASEAFGRYDVRRRDSTETFGAERVAPIVDSAAKEANLTETMGRTCKRKAVGSKRAKIVSF